MSDINIQDLAKKAESGDGCAIKDALSKLTSDSQLHMTVADKQIDVLNQVVDRNGIDVKQDPTAHELMLVETDGVSSLQPGAKRVSEHLELYRFDLQGKNPVKLYDEVYDSRSRKLASRCPNDQGDAK